MLSRPAEITRRHDPDRFLTALFAPARERETLFALYAFNHELARAREAAREPVAALIRLQWWREVIEGARRAHEVATPLGAALDAGRLAPDDLLGMVEGRAAEADGIETVADWRAYLLATAGGVAVAAARALGARGDAVETARRYGAAYGAASIRRHAVALAAHGRALLPPGAGAASVTAAEASRWLAEGDASPMPRCGLPAILVATLARRDLRRPPETRPGRGVGDRMAVLAAAIAGRP